MADLPDKKVLKETPDGGSIDRLSALPDCVLLHILSFCETKDAAATSILSTRWRKLFLLLPDIDLDIRVHDDTSVRDKLFSDFIHFTNRVIGQRNKASIRKIQLYVEDITKRHKLALESWLTSAATAVSFYNVQEFEISVLIDIQAVRFSISIPPEIFVCKSLVSLSLNHGADCIVPNLVSLPNLKVLHLDEIKFVDEDSIQRFLQGCPLLEVLILYLRPCRIDSESEEGVEVKVLDILSPLLKKLMLFWHEEVEFGFTIVVKSNNLNVFYCFLGGQFKVTIDAPNLKSLSILGHLLEVNVVQNLVSIENAVIEVEFLHNMTTESNLLQRAQHAFELINGLQNVKSLKLSGMLLKALYFSQGVLPTFKNLIKLELSPFDCPAFPRECMSSMLSSLFESSPNLEVLIFSEVSKNYISKNEDLDSVFQEVLPLMLVEHLKEIEIKTFKGEAHQLKLVEFFLKSGKSLKKMTLFGAACPSLPEVLERILSYKKCSDNCQIVPKEEWDWLWSS